MNIYFLLIRLLRRFDENKVIRLAVLFGWFLLRLKAKDKVDEMQHQ